MNEYLKEYGYMFLINPASSAVATLGDAINNGAGGMKGVKYGTIRDWMIGLELILPNEEASLIRLSCRTVSAGRDWIPPG